ncbi:MAG: hypothetical protein ACI8YW_000481, partial [Flavobacteriaceae bacterium]
MKIFTKHLVLLGLLTITKLCSAQENLTKGAVMNKDSILLAQYNKKINDIESLRETDSIKKESLLAEINSLKTTDNLKKEELLLQLKDIKNEEAENLAVRKSTIEQLREKNIGYPVIGFFNDTLFTVYSNLGSFSAKERASAV